ncbi:MAG: nitrogenase [Peptococcaceae bacterium]|nr:nitrogenase [Peptococcaceae bacterium]
MTEIKLATSNVEVRENRLGSIANYIGDVQNLHDCARCGTLRDRGNCFTQANSCANIEALVISLARIRNVAIINHGPRGCVANAALPYAFNRAMETAQFPNRTVYIGTDMRESDTVFGAVESLRETARETVRRYQPEALFISNTCTSAIIGEDIDALVDELKGELRIPIAAVHCEGFRSKIWATGFDVADHAVLTSGIIQPPRETRRVINFKNFRESERSRITEMFAELDVTPQFLYCGSDVEQLSHLSESLATVTICDTLGTYLGNVLEQQYGVPYVRTISPLGVTGFETWFREVARLAGREEKAEAYIQRQREIYLPQIEEIKKDFQDVECAIGMGPGFTFEISRVLQELGFKVIHGISWHFDSSYDHGGEPESLRYLAENGANFPFTVSDNQNHEQSHILKNAQPEIYFTRHPGSSVWAVKLGIPSLFVSDEYAFFGYARLLQTAKTIRDTLKNRSFVNALSAHVKTPYTDWWYAQNRQDFMKEVL